MPRTQKEKRKKKKAVEVAKKVEEKKQFREPTESAPEPTSKPVEKESPKPAPKAPKDKSEPKPVDLDPRKFGEHVGITCDGCGSVPVIGFRYRCLKCKDSSGQFNHDICENCLEDFKRGELQYATQGQNRISADPKDHEFQTYVDRKQFKPLSAGGAPPPGPSDAAKKKKVKPNDQCPCGSGKKFKKCCAAKQAVEE